MKIGNLFNVFKPVMKQIEKHDRTILTAVTVVSTLYAVYRAAKDGPKFKKILEECKEDGCTTFETAKRLAPAAVPTAAATAVAVGSALCMNKVCSDTINGLSSALGLAQAAKTEIIEHTEKIAGPETAQKIKESVAKSHVNADLPGGGTAGINNIVVTGHGNDVFYDDFSGRWFYSDINFIKKAVNDLNYQLINDMFVGLEEFYAYLDLPPIGASRFLGWNVDYGTIELDFTADLDETGKPYTVMMFKSNSEPSSKYDRRW